MLRGPPPPAGRKSAARRRIRPPRARYPPRRTRAPSRRRCGRPGRARGAVVAKSLTKSEGGPPSTPQRRRGSGAGLRLDALGRVALGMTLFQAAYMAEVVRGGLQGLPRGQAEAAADAGQDGSSGKISAHGSCLSSAAHILYPPMVFQGMARTLKM